MLDGHGEESEMNTRSTLTLNNAKGTDRTVERPNQLVWAQVVGFSDRTNYDSIRTTTKNVKSSS